MPGDGTRRGRTTAAMPCRRTPDVGPGLTRNSAVRRPPTSVRVLSSAGQRFALCALLALAIGVASSVAAPEGPESGNAGRSFDAATLQRGAQLAAVGDCS